MATRLHCYLAQAGEVPVRDFLRELWGYVGSCALMSFICSAVAVLLWPLASPLGLRIAGQDMLLICGCLTVGWGLRLGVMFLAGLPRLARTAEERIGLRANLRRALGNAVDESNPLDEGSLLELSFRGLHAISVPCRTDVTWGWDTKILDESGRTVVHLDWFGRRNRYTALLQSWLAASQCHRE